MPLLVQDYEQMKAAGEVDEEVNSDEEDRQISIDEGAGSMEPEPEPEPEASMGDGAAELLASVTGAPRPPPLPAATTNFCF